MPTGSRSKILVPFNFTPRININQGCHPSCFSIARLLLLCHAEYQTYSNHQLSLASMYREEMGIVIFDGEHTVPREKASIPQKPADKYTKEPPLPILEPNTDTRQYTS